METTPFLIHIVTQEALFNEEISTITYIKDITFGVLYEQVKVQNQLKDVLTNTFQKKMEMPLDTIVKNIETLENSKILQDEDSQVKQFKTQIYETKLQAKLIIFQLKDLKDWNSIQNNSLRLVSHKFDLHQAL